jgi:uncharacterized membrane protein YoaK (UPF0700 family)
MVTSCGSEGLSLSSTFAAAPRTTAMNVALSVIAGVTDVTSWLLLGGFFSAHVTGNLVVLSADLVDGHTPAPAALLAIPVFIAVAAVATTFATRSRAAAVSTGLSLLAAQAILLSAAAALSFVTVASADPTAPLAVIIGLLAVSAMAAQNAYLHLIAGAPATTAVMTGNMVAATVSGVKALRSRGADSAAAAHWKSSWPLIVGFVVGCVVGAGAATAIGDHAAVVPAVLALALLTAASIRRASPGAHPRAGDAPKRDAEKR